LESCHQHLKPQIAFVNSCMVELSIMMKSLITFFSYQANKKNTNSNLGIVAEAPTANSKRSHLQRSLSRIASINRRAVRSHSLLATKSSIMRDRTTRSTWIPYSPWRLMPNLCQSITCGLIHRVTATCCHSLM